MNALRRFFRLLNKYFMVPVFRLGLGPFMGNPFSGYIMVLKTTGRKTGRERYAPVNYAILDGKIYCLSGFGKNAHWYRNLSAHPQIETILPAATLSGTAATVTDADEWLRAARRILKNSGFAGFLSGYNAFTVSDEELRARGDEMIVVRITPNGVRSGAADPGGWLWLWIWAATIALIAVFLVD
ncbi:MAG: nitroreductase family deazaflavin-dependent oxidoreductase [Chloroflexi bacterium]|nr:nitroreductase family deazaflavin-dependent oxidoreductase [Chloroflexota bacterium]